LTLEELLKDRAKMMKLIWIGFISSLVFIAIGVVLILLELAK
jgi:hypothetical protein